MIEGQNFFDKPIKYYFKKYDNTYKFETGEEDDYTTGCL